MGNLKKVFVGFSINPELVLRFSAEPGFEKIPGNDFDIIFSGSSANIANALGSLWGVNTTLLGAVGIKRNKADDLLDIALRQSIVPLQRIPLLTETSFATVLSNELAGDGLVSYKGKIVPDCIPSAIDKISQTLNGDEGFRIASGVTEGQTPLAKVFWGDHEGLRTFCPHKTLLKNREVFLDLCHFVDLVIMNSSEFALLGLNFTDIHKCGVRLVVITDSVNGGVFSLGGKLGSYQAQKSEGIIFGTGAGDWTHAMIVYFLRDNFLDFTTASFGDIKEAIYFASRVASLKVTYIGGSNGPRKEDFIS